MLPAPVPSAWLREAHREVERWLRAGHEVTVLVSSTDVTTVETVARLRVLADRVGGALEVVGADPEVFEVCGLRELL